MSDKPQEPQERGRTQRQVNEDMQSAGFDARNPNQPQAEVEEPSLPDPKKKTDQEMNEHPDDVLGVDGKPF